MNVLDQLGQMESTKINWNPACPYIYNPDDGKDLQKDLGPFATELHMCLEKMKWIWGEWRSRGPSCPCLMQQGGPSGQQQQVWVLEAPPELPCSDPTASLMRIPLWQPWPEPYKGERPEECSSSLPKTPVSYLGEICKRVSHMIQKLIIVRTGLHGPLGRTEWPGNYQHHPF